MSNRKDCTQNDMVIDGQKISTWYSKGVDNEYMAVNMTAVLRILDGYDLTELEKTSLPDLMAGYCRLVDESDMTGYGDCEFEAIENLFHKAKARGKVKAVDLKNDLFGASTGATP